MGKTTELTTLLEGYRLYCVAEGKSPRTTRWYQHKLRIFLDYLRAQGLSTDAADVTTTHLRAFLVHLADNVKADELNPNKPTRDEHISPKTVQGYARTVKAFFSWAEREGYVSGNPGRLLRIPKAPATIVPTFSDAQIKALSSVIDLRRSCGFRDYAILLTLLDTGIRLSELVNLRMQDVDWQQALLKVMGKGAKERLVPFGAKVQTTLWKYTHKFRPEPVHPNIENVFLMTTGWPAGRDEVYRRIKEYGKKAGLQGVRCSPHTFRHTSAEKFLTNGGDLFSLQKILGPLNAIARHDEGEDAVGRRIVEAQHGEGVQPDRLGHTAELLVVVVAVYGVVAKVLLLEVQLLVQQGLEQVPLRPLELGHVEGDLVQEALGVAAQPVESIDAVVDLLKGDDRLGHRPAIRQDDGVEELLVEALRPAHEKDVLLTVLPVDGSLGIALHGVLGLVVVRRDEHTPLRRPGRPRRRPQLGRSANVALTAEHGPPFLS